MRGRALLFSALLACGPTPPGETDGSTAASSTAADDSTAASPTSANTTSTTDPTTGGPQPDLPSVDPEAACAAHCDALAACGLPVTPECVENCVASLGTPTGGPKPGCFEADAALTACLATLSCDVLKSDNPARACDSEMRAMLTACQLCNHDGGWIEEGTSCYVDRLCPDGLLRVDCDADTCACSVEGVVTEICPSKGCIPEGFPQTDLTCCGVR